MTEKALLTEMPTPRVAVIAVTYFKNSLLLVRRTKEPQKNTWGFPGGSVEAGETLYAAALRELYEETGVNGYARQIIDVVEVIGTDPDGNHHHFVLVAILCEFREGNAVANDDVDECCWVSVTPEGLDFQGPLAEQVEEIALKACNLLMA